jgi:hypothetical protein
MDYFQIVSDYVIADFIPQLGHLETYLMDYDSCSCSNCSMDLFLFGNTVYFVDLSYVLDMDYYAGSFNNWDVLNVTDNYFIGLNL